MAASKALFPTKCVCGCGRRLPPLAVEHRDPFATSRCCRLAHGLKAEDAAALAASIVSTKMVRDRRRKGEKSAFDTILLRGSVEFEGDYDARKLFEEA